MESLGIDKLSLDEQIFLVQEIRDSIAAERTLPSLSEAKRDELRRRAAEDDASPEDAIPWEEVKARIQARLRGV